MLRRQRVPGRIVGVEGPLVQVPLRDPLDAAHDLGLHVQQVRVHGKVADHGVLGQQREPGVGDQRLRRIAPRGGVHEQVRQQQARLEVLGITGEVPAGRDDLHAGQPSSRVGLIAGVVAVLGGELDRVASDPARPHDQHLDRGAARAAQLGPRPLQRRERARDPVPGHAPKVLHQPPAVLVADEVERNGIDPEPGKHPDTRRPGGEVEHRDEDGTPVQEVVPALGRPEHDHDVLPVAVLLVAHDHVGREHAVVEIGVAHAGSDATLDVDLGPVRGQQADEGRQEVPPLARLSMHAWEPDGHAATRCHPASCRSLHRGASILAGSPAGHAAASAVRPRGPGSAWPERRARRDAMLSG